MTKYLCLYCVNGLCELHGRYPGLGGPAVVSCSEFEKMGMFSGDIREWERLTGGCGK